MNRVFEPAWIGRVKLLRIPEVRLKQWSISWAREQAVPGAGQGWEVFSTSSGSNCRTCAWSNTVNRDCSRETTMESHSKAWYSYSYCFPSLPKPRGNEMVLCMAFGQRDNLHKNWDKEGWLVAFFFKIVKSNFPTCKTFLKTDLFLRNCQTSTLLEQLEAHFRMIGRAVSCLGRRAASSYGQGHFLLLWAPDHSSVTH